MDSEARKVVEIGYGGNERLIMNMGPQHPSAHGVFRALLVLEGETVVGVDTVIGYLHRCHEKLGETLTYVQYPSIASKTDYVAAMTSELAYVSAVEKIAKFEVPRRAQYLRVIAAELQRIASHCLWLGTWCLDMGGALGGVRRLRLRRSGRDRRRLLCALPRADGRVPAVDPDRAPGARRAPGGSDLVAAGREVGRTGPGAQGRRLRTGGGRAGRGRLLHRERRRPEGVPHEVAGRVLLEPRGPAAHRARPQGRGRGGDHGLGRPRVRRGGPLA